MPLNKLFSRLEIQVLKFNLTKFSIFLFNQINLETIKEWNKILNSILHNLNSAKS